MAEAAMSWKSTQDSKLTAEDCAHTACPSPSPSLHTTPYICTESPAPARSSHRRSPPLHPQQTGPPRQEKFPVQAEDKQNHGLPLPGRHQQVLFPAGEARQARIQLSSPGDGCSGGGGSEANAGGCTTTTTTTTTNASSNFVVVGQLLEPKCPTRQWSITPEETSQFSMTLMLVGVGSEKSEMFRVQDHEVVCAISAPSSFTDCEGKVISQVDLSYFWCNFCSFKTATKSLMVQHLMGHRMHCKYCAYQAYSRANIVQHSYLSHPKQFGGLAANFNYCVLLPDYLRLTSCSSDDSAAPPPPPQDAIPPPPESNPKLRKRKRPLCECVKPSDNNAPHVCTDQVRRKVQKQLHENYMVYDVSVKDGERSEGAEVREMGCIDNPPPSLEEVREMGCMEEVREGQSEGCMDSPPPSLEEVREGQSQSPVIQEEDRPRTSHPSFTSSRGSLSESWPASHHSPQEARSYPSPSPDSTSISHDPPSPSQSSLDVDHHHSLTPHPMHSSLDSVSCPPHLLPERPMPDRFEPPTHSSSSEDASQATSPRMSTPSPPSLSSAGGGSGAKWACGYCSYSNVTEDAIKMHCMRFHKGKDFLLNPYNNVTHTQAQENLAPPLILHHHDISVTHTQAQETLAPPLTPHRDDNVTHTQAQETLAPPLTRYDHRTGSTPSSAVEDNEEVPFMDDNTLPDLVEEKTVNALLPEVSNKCEEPPVLTKQNPVSFDHGFSDDAAFAAYYDNNSVEVNEEVQVAYDVEVMNNEEVDDSASMEVEVQDCTPSSVPLGSPRELRCLQCTFQSWPQDLGLHILRQHDQHSSLSLRGVDTDGNIVFICPRESCVFTSTCNQTFLSHMQSCLTDWASPQGDTSHLGNTTRQSEETGDCIQTEETGDCIQVSVSQAPQSSVSLQQSSLSLSFKQSESLSSSADKESTSLSSSSPPKQSKCSSFAAKRSKSSSGKKKKSTWKQKKEQDMESLKGKFSCAYCKNCENKEKEEVKRHVIDSHSQRPLMIRDSYKYCKHKCSRTYFCRWCSWESCETYDIDKQYHVNNCPSKQKMAVPSAEEASEVSTEEVSGAALRCAALEDAPQKGCQERLEQEKGGSCIVPVGDVCLSQCQSKDNNMKCIEVLPAPGEQSSVGGVDAKPATLHPHPLTPAVTDSLLGSSAANAPYQQSSSQMTSGHSGHVSADQAVFANLALVERTGDHVELLHGPETFDPTLSSSDVAAYHHTTHDNENCFSNAPPDPLNAPPDPLNAPPDPLNAPPDPLNAPPDPLNAPPDPLNARSDPLVAYSNKRVWYTEECKPSEQSGDTTANTSVDITLSLPSIELFTKPITSVSGHHALKANTCVEPSVGPNHQHSPDMIVPKEEVGLLDPQLDYCQVEIPPAGNGPSLQQHGCPSLLRRCLEAPHSGTPSNKEVWDVANVYQRYTSAQTDHCGTGVVLSLADSSQTSSCTDSVPRDPGSRVGSPGSGQSHGSGERSSDSGRDGGREEREGEGRSQAVTKKPLPGTSTDSSCPQTPEADLSDPSSRPMTPDDGCVGGLTKALTSQSSAVDAACSEEAVAATAVLKHASFSSSPGLKEHMFPCRLKRQKVAAAGKGGLSHKTMRQIPMWNNAHQLKCFACNLPCLSMAALKAHMADKHRRMHNVPFKSPYHRSMHYKSNFFACPAPHCLVFNYSELFVVGHFKQSHTSLKHPYNNPDYKPKPMKVRQRTTPSSSKKDMPKEGKKQGGKVPDDVSSVKESKTPSGKEFNGPNNIKEAKKYSSKVLDGVFSFKESEKSNGKCFDSMPRKESKKARVKDIDRVPSSVKEKKKSSSKDLDWVPSSMRESKKASGKDLIVGAPSVVVKKVAGTPSWQAKLVGVGGEQQQQPAEQKYMCLYCESKVYMNALQDMKAHYVSTHPGQSIIVRDVGAHREKRPSRVYLCDQDVCSFSTYDQPGLATHADSTHTDESLQSESFPLPADQSYQCGSCGWLTSEESSVRKHVWDMHQLDGGATVVTLAHDKDRQALEERFIPCVPETCH